MSQSNNNQSSSFNYGGQAVLEGVMMRGSKMMSVAVLNPEGNIFVHVEPLNQKVYGSKWAKLPFLRGLLLLWDALGLGVKALLFSANVAIPEEENQELSGMAQYGPVALSLLMWAGLFIALPAFLSGLLEQWLGIQNIAWLGNLIEGLIRLTLVVGYIGLIGFVPDIARLYGYHGAEHKTIHAYEAGEPLTPESVARFPLEHPRCGTAFLLTVVVISVLFYTLFPPLNLGLRIVSRLVLLPLIAGTSYEILRFTAKHQEHPLIRLIIIPNLALQRLTTREPDAQMLEVAIASLEHVLAFEEANTIASLPIPTISPVPVLNT